MTSMSMLAQKINVKRLYHGKKSVARQIRTVASVSCETHVPNRMHSSIGA